MANLERYFGIKVPFKQILYPLVLTMLIMNEKPLLSIKKMKIVV